MYAAQETLKIDTARAEKDPFRTETSSEQVRPDLFDLLDLLRNLRSLPPHAGPRREGLPGLHFALSPCRFLFALGVVS